MFVQRALINSARVVARNASSKRGFSTVRKNSMMVSHQNRTMFGFCNKKNGVSIVGRNFSSDAKSQDEGFSPIEEQPTRYVSIYVFLTISDLREQILESALLLVPKHGWSIESIGLACEQLGYSSATHGLFPNGSIDLVMYFIDKCNRQLYEQVFQMNMEK